jgi:tripartite-type tricarboxylate transporter receptor subunit TctC
MNIFGEARKTGRIGKPLRVWLSASLLLVGTGFGTGASAQDWPNKTVRIVVAFPPGSPGDAASRIVADKLGQALKQPVIVENRPGAGGNIGAEVVAKSPADGYTILEAPDTLLTVNPHVYSKLNFKPDDLMPLTSMASFNQLLVCHPSVPAKDLTELMALAKKQDMNYASGGAGVPGHLAMELFLSMTNLKMTHVAYKGPSPAAQDLLGGQVPCGYLASPVVAPYVKAGKLTGLAVSGVKRSVMVPQVPTMAEAGVKGYDATFWEMLYLPKGTPEPVVNRLNQEIAKVLKMPEVREKLNANDLDPIGNTPSEAAQQIKAASEKWGPVVKQINLRVD